MIYETDYIMHYNYNHDKLGRFAKSGTGSSRRVMSKISKKVDKKISEPHGSISGKKAAKYLNKIDKRIAVERISQKRAYDKSQYDKVGTHMANEKYLIDLGNEIVNDMSKTDGLYYKPVFRRSVNTGKSIVSTILTNAITLPFGYTSGSLSFDKIPGRYYKSGTRRRRKYEKVTSIE